MRILVFLIIAAFSINTFACEGENFCAGDSMVIKITQDIPVGAGDAELRTSCGILVVVEKGQKRVLKAGESVTLSVRNTVFRTWNTLDRISGSDSIKKVFLPNSKTFSQARSVAMNCSEIEIVSITPGA